MNSFIKLESEKIDELLSKLKYLEVQLSKKKRVEDEFLDNEEFIRFMNISKRTAQTWRDSGIMSFSQVGSKIYYRMTDIQKLLDTHHNEAKKK